MSTIGNTSGVPDPILNPLESPPPSTTSNPSNEYYTSGISSAASSATTQTTADGTGIPTLPQPKNSRVSIGDFQKLMSEVIRTFRQQSAEDSESDVEILRAYHKSISLNVAGLKELLDWSQNVEKANIALQVDYNNLLIALNVQIMQFNSGAVTEDDNKALASINEAIVKYNEAQAAYKQAQTDFAAGTLSQEDLDKATADFTNAQLEYTNAVTIYNDYGKLRYESLKLLIDEFKKNTLDTFALQTLEVNKLITTYNQLAGPGGLPPVGHPQKPRTPTIEIYAWKPLDPAITTTIPEVVRPFPIPTYPPTIITGIQAQVVVIQAIIDAAVDELSAALKNFVSDREANEASIEYYKFKEKFMDKKANPVIEDEAIVPASKQILKAGSSSGTPSGVDFITMVGQMINPDMAALIKNIETPSRSQTNNVNATNPHTDIRMTMMMAQFLLSAGVFGGKAAVGILGNNLAQTPPESNAAKIAAVLGFTKELQKLAGTDIYEKAVEQILQNGAIKPSAEDTENGVSDIKLAGALMAVFQLSRTLESPELMRQVVVAVGGQNIPEIKELLAQPPGGTLVDTLSDPISKHYLKENLTQELVAASKTSPADAEKAIEQAVNEVATRAPVLTESNLSGSLKTALQNQNIDPTVAATLADKAFNFLRDEQAHPELNFALNKPNIDKAVLDNSLFTNSTITQAVNTVLSGDPIHSQRQFRAELIQELQLTGMQQPEALKTANAVLAAINGVSGATASNRKPVTNAAASTEESIKNAVSTQSLRALQKDLDVVPSHEITNELIASVFGEDRSSVINVIRESIQMTEKNGSKEERARLADKIAVYLKPNVELFAFAQSLMDPANNIIFSASTGIMYQGNEPANFRKSIDVLI